MALLDYLRKTKGYTMIKNNKIDRLRQIPILIGVMLTSNVFGELAADEKIEKYINSSDLVLYFVLIDKTSTEETMLQNFTVLENGMPVMKDLMTTGIYTTYTLGVKEVLSGSFDQKNLEVKMSGGCYEGHCATVSIGYDYELNQEGVIFLKYDDVSGNYFSYDATYSAFKVDSNEKLYRGEKEPNTQDQLVDELFNKGATEQYTVSTLRQKIADQKFVKESDYE